MVEIAASNRCLRIFSKESVCRANCRVSFSVRDMPVTYTSLAFSIVKMNAIQYCSTRRKIPITFLTVKIVLLPDANLLSELFEFLENKTSTRKDDSFP